MLIKGADRKQTNNDGKTALEIARDKGREELVKIMDDEYSCWHKFKIKSIKKIVYAPEEDSYMYSVFFILLFHLFFLPVNILAEFKIDEKYVKTIPFIFEGIYEVMVIVLYLLLLKKFRKRKPQDLRSL